MLSELPTLSPLSPRSEYSLPPAMVIPLYPRLYPPVLHKPWISRGQVVGISGHHGVCCGKAGGKPGEGTSRHRRARGDDVAVKR